MYYYRATWVGPNITALYARKHIKLLVYSGALSPLLTLSPLEDNFTLGHKCPTVVYFGALHLSRILKSLKVCSAEARNLSSAMSTHAGLNYKERLNHLKLLPLMHHFELADIMFLVSSLKHPTERFNVLQFVKLQDINTRSSDRLTLKHVRCMWEQFSAALLFQ